MIIVCGIIVRLLKKEIYRFMFLLTAVEFPRLFRFNDLARKNIVILLT